MILCWLLSSFAWAAQEVDIYSETVAYNERDLYATATRVRQYFVFRTTYLSPFVQAGNDQFGTLSNEQKTNSLSHNYVSAGLGLRQGIFQLFLEQRHKEFYGPETLNQKKSDKDDSRALLVIAHNKSRYLTHVLGSKLYAFYDLYSETLYSSATENNIINTSMIKAGTSLGFENHTLDPFIELYLGRDKNLDFYNNTNEYRGHLRYKLNMLSWSLSLTYSGIQRQLIDRGTLNQSPEARVSFSHRLMFVFGSYFGV